MGADGVSEKGKFISASSPVALGGVFTSDSIDVAKVSIKGATISGGNAGSNSGEPKYYQTSDKSVWIVSTYDPDEKKIKMVKVKVSVVNGNQVGIKIIGAVWHCMM